MTDASFTPLPERELLAVFPTIARAEQARDALLARGVPPASMRIDEESDEIASLRAEMREELTHAWIVPNAAFVATKEGIKGMGVVGFIAIAIALAIAVPLAFLDFGSTFWVRLAWFSVIAVALGGTIGFVAGGAAGTKSPAELLGAQRGTVLRVNEDTPEIREVLLGLDPIRMDEVTDEDRPVRTVATEERRRGEGVIDNLTANVGGDDYEPQAHPERSANRRRD